MKCSPDAEKATFSCVTSWLYLKLQICHSWWRLWGTSATLLPARTCSCSGNGSQILSSVTRTCWQATSHHWKKSIFLNHFFYATISSSCLRSSSLSLSLSFFPFFSFSGACFTKGVVTALSSSAFPYYRKEK